jgi:hypothetical protein
MAVTANIPSSKLLVAMWAGDTTLKSHFFNPKETKGHEGKA